MPHPLCIETIAVENRRFKNLDYHQSRLSKTRLELWDYTDPWKLSDCISIPDSISNDLHKCRVAYHAEIDNIQWETYTPRSIAKIRKVYHNSVDYSYKYDQRPQLNALFAQRGDADEILVIKEGMVTDTYVCNVAFFDGSNWFTPDTYLLPGTQRAMLLEQGIIQETSIRENDMTKYSHVKLFNAMMNWGSAPILPIGMIV